MRLQVHMADWQDRMGSYSLLEGITKLFPRLTLIWADQAYCGEPLRNWMANQGCRLQVVNRPRRWIMGPDGWPVRKTISGFVVLPRRWVVERTFAWMGRNRRLAKDYEGQCQTEEAWRYLSMIHLMLRRLTL